MFNFLHAVCLRFRFRDVCGNQFPISYGRNVYPAHRISIPIEVKHTGSAAQVLRVGQSISNIVPRTAKAVVASGDNGEYDTIRTKAEAFAEETGYNLKTRKVGTSLAIEATGISAHGADPHKGLNAISILMAFFGFRQR